MAFEESLKHALELQGKAKAFQMSEPVCLTHSMQWMIDQILGREFGADDPFMDVSWHGEIKQVMEQTDRKLKAAKLYKKLERVDKTGSHPTAEATREYLSKKFRQQVDVDDTPGDPSLKQGVGDIKRHANMEGQVACMISLRTVSVYGKGAGGKTFNHALALFSCEENVRLFDPNMGEVTLPRGNFAEWFDGYHSQWATRRQMRNVNSASVFRVYAPVDVNQYGKSLKKEIERKFEDEFKLLRNELGETEGITPVFEKTLSQKLSPRERAVANTSTDHYAFMQEFDMEGF